MGPATATLEKKEFIRDNVLLLSFRLSQNASFAFNPGQYIWLILPSLVAADPAGNRRAFSLTSSIQDLPVIQVLIKLSDSGYKQTCKQLEVGTEVSVEGPFGSAFSIDSQKSDRRHVMIAGGCGISPFLSVMRSELTLPNSLYHLITISKSAELALA
jgi:ferredoxin-NADP reductase